MQVRMSTRAARMGAALLYGAVMLAAACNASAQATLRVGGTGSALGTVRLMANAFATHASTKTELSVFPSMGSSGAIRALKAGAIDMALISRPLKPEDAAAGLHAFEYGRSPFVFVTSKAGVKNITTSMVADFLSGRVMSWPDGQPVRFVMRPSSDGDNAYLAGFSPDIARALKVAHQRPGLVVAPTDQDAADEAERLPGSLAVNTLALILSENRKLNVINLDGTPPTVKALADGVYPHFKPLLIITRGEPSGALRQFVDYYRSPQGRAILERNGHSVPN